MLRMMTSGLTRRLLSVLQLARLALVFTAIADGAASLLLLAELRPDVSGPLTVMRVITAALVSVGLYGFGMTLNDIIDRRRDEQLAAHRPLPSGRIGVTMAHVVCTTLLLLAVAGGTFYSLGRGSWMSLILVALTALLVVFYDLAG